MAAAAGVPAVLLSPLWLYQPDGGPANRGGLDGDREQVPTSGIGLIGWIWRHRQE
jgi:hypothetical protein